MKAQISLWACAMAMAAQPGLAFPSMAGGKSMLDIMGTPSSNEEDTALASNMTKREASSRDYLAGTKNRYIRPSKSDSRSPCPGLNALANHGYINRSGKRLNLVSLVSGAFTGLGVSPETSAFVGAVGYGSTKDPLSLSFDLEDLSRHGLLIEHDCSFSRQDYDIGNNNVFNRELWDVALNVLKKKSMVRGAEMGKAKSARIRDQMRRNPKTAYGPRASGFGAIEVGMVIAAMGGGIGSAKLEYVRSIFEQERIPSHLGWKRSPLSDNAAFTLGIGAACLAADPQVIDDSGRVVLSTPADIFSVLEGLLGKSGKGSGLDIFSSFFGGSGQGGGDIFSSVTGKSGSSKKSSKSTKKKSKDAFSGFTDFFKRGENVAHFGVVKDVVTSLGFNASRVDRLEQLMGEMSV